MAGPVGSDAWMYSTGGGGFYPHGIKQSLRFNDDDSAYLTRTPSVAGNRKTWTWSGWVKRGNLGVLQYLFGSSASNPKSGFYIGNDDRLMYRTYNGSVENVQVYSTQVFRDASAWYHIIVSYDSTQATASNRIKFYVNGSLITSYSTATYPTQNYDCGINNAVRHEIGSYDYGFHTFDGYLAEVNLVDGQALDHTSFGEFKSGVWIPKRYSGTYGTNGFYLDFGNSGSLGADVSGNGNNWTPTNLASTDQMLDTPTNNFCTFNPLDDNYNHFLYEGNTKASSPSVTHATIKGGMFVNSGKWYAEFYIVNESSTGAMVGVASAEASGKNYLGATSGGVGYNHDGNIYANGGAPFAGGAILNNGNVVGVAADVDANEIKFYKNNLLQTTLTSLMASEICFAAGHGGETVSLNCGQDSSFAGYLTRQGNTDANGIGDFYYAPPAGYLALCSANLPAPVIDPAEEDIPTDYFNTVTYTGNGGTQSITGVGFQPDLVWGKLRPTYSFHRLQDVVRGPDITIPSNLTHAETVGNGLVSFDSDGFTMDSGTDINQTSPHVAWNWKAGGAAVTNTDGAVTSQVSANQKAGFSIVTWTNPSVSNGTIGHGLATEPDIILSKNRSIGGWPWLVYNKSIGPTKYLILSSNSAATTDANVWSGTINSTVFSTGQVAYFPAGSAALAYCFHSVEGFSKIGSYTGNGSTDGTFVYTGFRPAFVMIKRTDVAASWIMKDTTRSPSNPDGVTLLADLDDAEYGPDNTLVDILSNGFKPRTVSTNVNTDGGSYIYMAFAEQPFKYANAR